MVEETLRGVRFIDTGDDDIEGAENTLSTWCRVLKIAYMRGGITNHGEQGYVMAPDIVLAELQKSLNKTGIVVKFVPEAECTDLPVPEAVQLIKAMYQRITVS
jgi:hypothetical protein